jgi:hypothetical protein
MSRFTRASILFVAALGLCATGSFANIPDPALSSVPAYITLTPKSNSQTDLVDFDFTVVVEGQGGPVANSFVEVEFSPDGDDLVTWCDGETHPLKSGVTGPNGTVVFTFRGGGCITLADFGGPTFIWQVRAGGVVLAEGAVNSPDAVDSGGRTVTQNNANNNPGSYVPNCDLVPPDVGTPSATVGLSDAVYHTPPISLGLISPCTKYTAPFDAAVTLGDAQLFTPFATDAGTCAATLACP